MPIGARMIRMAKPGFWDHEEPLGGCLARHRGRLTPCVHPEKEATTSGLDAEPELETAIAKPCCALLVHGAQLVDACAPVEAFEEPHRQVLRQCSRLQARGLEDPHEWRDEGARCHDPPHPKPRTQGLRKSTEKDPSVQSVRQEGPGVAAREVEFAVGVVLDDEDSRRFRESCEIEALLVARQSARWVLKMRDDVH